MNVSDKFPLRSNPHLSSLVLLVMHFFFTLLAVLFRATAFSSPVFDGEVQWNDPVQDFPDLGSTASSKEVRLEASADGDLLNSQPVTANRYSFVVSDWKCYLPRDFIMCCGDGFIGCINCKIQNF